MRQGRCVSKCHQNNLKAEVVTVNEPRGTRVCVYMCKKHWGESLGETHTFKGKKRIHQFKKEKNLQCINKSSSLN